MAMERVSVEVPSELVGPVRETVLLLYEATLESLQLSLRAHAEGRGPLDQVGLDAQRERLAQLDELAGSLGWERASSGEPDSGSGARQLDAPADLLHDAFYGALIDAGERLAVTASTSWRGELPLERVQEAAAEVLALHRLLRLLESLRPRP
jgi:hypothetical protein